MNKTIKIIILAVLAIFGVSVFGWLTKLAFSLDLGWTARTIYLTLAFMIGIGFWGITIYLIENRWVAYVTSLAAIMAMFLYIPINLYYCITLAIILIYSIFAIERLRVEKEGRIKIMLYESTNTALKSIATAMCLVAALNYYYSPASSQTQFNFPEKYQEKIISYVLPGFNQNMTVDEFTYALMAKQEGIKDFNLKDYIANKKIEIDPENFSNYKNSIIERLKLTEMNLTGQEKLNEVKIFEKLYQDQVEEYFIKYGKIIRLVLAVLFFSVTYGILRIAYPLIYLVLWLLLKFFEKSKFITISKKQVTAEKVEI